MCELRAHRVGKTTTRSDLRFLLTSESASKSAAIAAEAAFESATATAESVPAEAAALDDTGIAYEQAQSLSANDQSQPSRSRVKQPPAIINRQAAHRVVMGRSFFGSRADRRGFLDDDDVK